MDFYKFINEEVIITHNDYPYERIKGILLNVIPAEQSENCVDTLVIDCNGIEKHVPTNQLLQFFPKNILDNEDAEYYYVIFRYGKTGRSKEHIYMSYDYSIKPGDKILVWQDWLYVGNVIKTGFYKKANAPYPVEKTWLIEQKVYDRIDFCKYSNATEIIKEENEYKDKYLNSKNSYKQYLAKVDYQYKWLAEDNTEFLEDRKPVTDNSEHMVNYIIGETEYNLEESWCESNQLDVFYRTLWICTYIAKYNGYHKFLFDKYLCLSLIYKHGDFDKFMLIPKIDKMHIEKDVCFLDKYISGLI